MDRELNFMPEQEFDYYALEFYLSDSEINNNK